ncbi:MAG TPA: class I SAM-dependent methyltransferase [Candidatus Dormibacteraeota bacterium]
MTFGSSLFFRLAYRLGFKPWDSGIPPPELVEVIEGGRRLPAGRALDLGCGTGTTSVYMASKGWQVTGVDFVLRPIRVARAKAAAAGLFATFLVGDVTRLNILPIEPGFDLFFDQGCFHSLPETSQAAYARQVTAMARPGATFLLYAFGRQPRASRRPFFPIGVSPDDVRSRFADFELVEARPGTDPFGSHWYTLRRR